MHPKSLFLAAATFVAVAALPSCATLASRDQYHVPIDSVPPGAVVAYQGANVGVTPCTVVLRRRCSQVTLRMPGYHDQVVEVGRGSNAWIIGNVLFGGVVGAVVDIGSGSTGTISEDPCWVELTPESDERPGVWLRPPSPVWTSDDDGWIPEGGTKPKEREIIEPKPTRAPKWVEPPKKPVPSDEDGWIKHGTGH